SVKCSVAGFTLSVRREATVATTFTTAAPPLETSSMRPDRWPGGAVARSVADTLTSTISSLIFPDEGVIFTQSGLAVTFQSSRPRDGVVVSETVAWGFSSLNSSVPGDTASMAGVGAVESSLQPPRSEPATMHTATALLPTRNIWNLQCVTGNSRQPPKAADSR